MKNLSEPVRAVIYSFFDFHDLLNTFSRISKNERILLKTKYSEILQISYEIEVFCQFWPQIEQAISMASEIYLNRLFGQDD